MPINCIELIPINHIYIYIKWIYVSHNLNLKCSMCRKSFENFLKEIEDFFVFTVYAGFAWMYIIVVPAWSDHGSERKGSDACNFICTWLSAIMWAWGSNSGDLTQVLHKYKERS